MVKETFSGWFDSPSRSRFADRSGFAHHDKREAVIFKLRHYPIFWKELKADLYQVKFEIEQKRVVRDFYTSCYPFRYLPRIEATTPSPIMAISPWFCCNAPATSPLTVTR